MYVVPSYLIFFLSSLIFIPISLMTCIHVLPGRSAVQGRLSPQRLWCAPQDDRMGPPSFYCAAWNADAV